MRHLKRNKKLGRNGEHRNAMLANLVCSLIKNKRVTTTLAKAKAARPVAEKMVTQGKKDTLHARRLVASRLRQHPRTLHKSSELRKAWREKEDVVRILFEDIAPVYKSRHGGYTRIIKLATRRGDAGQKAILEWVDIDMAPAEEAPKAEEKAPAAGGETESGTAAQDSSKSEKEHSEDEKK